MFSTSNTAKSCFSVDAVISDRRGWFEPRNVLLNKRVVPVHSSSATDCVDQSNSAGSQCARNFPEVGLVFGTGHVLHHANAYDSLVATPDFPIVPELEVDTFFKPPARDLSIPSLTVGVTDGNTCSSDTVVLRCEDQQSSKPASDVE